MTRVDRALEIVVVFVVPLAAAGAVAAAASVVGRALSGAVLAAGLIAVAALVTEVRQAKRKRRRRFALLITLGALSTLGGVTWFAESRPLTSLSREALKYAFANDAALMEAHTRGLESVLRRMGALGLPPEGGATLSAEQERQLLESWHMMLSYAVALESLRLFYEDYYRIDLAERRDDHVTGFLLTFAADAALFENAARFAQKVLENDNAKKFLDIPHPALRDMPRLPASSFSHFREEMLGLRDSMRIRAGEHYLALVADWMPVGDQAEVAAAAKAKVEGHLAAIAELGELPTMGLTARSELQRFKRGLIRSWYPIQAKAAEMLGDTRVRRVGEYLIDPSLQHDAEAVLEPGDIMLSRKNWYLSNVGLPGFWPHAILYVGAPGDLEPHFEDARVVRWLDATFGHTRIDQALATRYPAAWRDYLDGGDKRVIEAISEGVTFSNMHECAGDYLAALRPRLDKLAKAKALVHAFAQFGKPYDYDFDFATDHALVCTELVYRAYRPAYGKDGIELTLKEMAGRSTLPANDIVAQYAREFGSDGAQLDFVLFIDARETEGRAFWSDEPSFRATAERTQWDIRLD